MHLGIYASAMKGCNLCRCLLIRTHAQRFGKSRDVELFWDTWQLELEIIYRLVPNLGAF
jgi:hypothetical protein